jgi:hypothetical protein
MRKIFRLSVSGIATFAVFILSVLAVFTAETAADELGYSFFIRGIIKHGWAMMLQTGYFELALWATFFFCGGAAALWADHFLRPINAHIKTKTKIESRVTGKTLQNIEITLDGIAYENCAFRNVTFIYDGGILEFTNNEVRGCQVKTNIPQTEKHVRFLAELGFIRVPLYGDKGKIELTGFKTSNDSG